jgi:hypothetical protein
MSISRKAKWTAALAAAVLAVAALLLLLGWLFGPAADRLTPHDPVRAAALNATRQILLATAAGTAALIGLAFTARTFYMSRRAQKLNWPTHNCKAPTLLVPQHGRLISAELT